MRYWPIPILTVLLLVLAFGFTTPTATAAPPAVVRVVLFYSDLCGNCHKVMQTDLPPLQARYGERLQIDLREVSSPAERARLRDVATRMGIAADHVGVPLLIIGDKALLGADQIPAELPALIETYLAQGGVDTPALIGLDSPAAAVAAQGINDEPLGNANNGLWLAWLIMAGMLAALVLAGVALVRGLPLLNPRLIDTLFPILAVVGMGVAIYLTFIEARNAPAICGPVGDCNTVQNSQYARFLGVPVGLIGLLGYIAMLAAWWWQRARDDTSAAYARLALFGMGLVGVLFSIYLTYLELFVIHAVCIWCLSSAVLMTLLFLLAATLVAPTRQADAGDEASLADPRRVA